MPTFEKPSADADEAQQALRGLAHATRSFKDPSDIYPSLSLSLAGGDGPSPPPTRRTPRRPQLQNGWMPTDSPEARFAAYRVP